MWGLTSGIWRTYTVYRVLRSGYEIRYCINTNRYAYVHMHVTLIKGIPYCIKSVVKLSQNSTRCPFQIGKLHQLYFRFSKFHQKYFTGHEISVIETKFWKQAAPTYPLWTFFSRLGSIDHRFFGIFWVKKLKFRILQCLECR